LQSGDGWPACCCSASHVVGVVMSVTEAVVRELDAMPDDLAQSALAAAALVLAEGLDSRASLAQKALGTKELRELMDRLRALAPARVEEDEVDRARRRRDERLTRLAATKDSASS
jgi:hypothetical protein